MSLFTELQNLMIKYRFQPSRKLSQHFIISEKVLGKLVEAAELNEKDTVLEIGAGTGFLTRELQKHCKVIAVEIDERLCTLLEEELPKENVQVVCRNFLEADLPPFNKVVSLPPYAHSAGIMHKLIQHSFDLGVLVLQKEFADKLIALPGFKEYCALSVLVQYYFNASAVGRVEAGHFFPKPRGESKIIKLVREKRFPEIKDREAFAAFIKSIFRFKNKNLRNALSNSFQFIKQYFKFSEQEFKKRVEGLDMKDVKVNLISVKEFVDIFNELAR